MGCQNSIKSVVGGTGSGLVGLHVKGTFIDKLFAIFRHELALGEVVSPSRVSKALRYQRIKNTEYKDMINKANTNALINKVSHIFETIVIYIHFHFTFWVESYMR